MKPKIDHLVIGAATLKQGVAYVRDQLGVDIPFGGVHENMGTHNHLIGLGKDIFLEVIAVNPKSKTLAQPRWYGLDDPFVGGQISKQASLLGWVVNTQNIEAFMRQTSFSFGRITPISRGNLNWLFGLPRDGRLLAAGILPYVIEWQSDTHPANKMQDAGCELRGLSLYHNNAPWLEAILGAIHAQDLVQVYSLDLDEAPCFQAHIDTPNGLKTLCSRPRVAL